MGSLNHRSFEEYGSLNKRMMRRQTLIAFLVALVLIGFMCEVAAAGCFEACGNQAGPCPSYCGSGISCAWHDREFDYVCTTGGSGSGLATGILRLTSGK